MKQGETQSVVQHVQSILRRTVGEFEVVLAIGMMLVRRGRQFRATCRTFEGYERGEGIGNKGPARGEGRVSLGMGLKIEAEEHGGLITDLFILQIVQSIKSNVLERKRRAGRPD